MQDLIKALTILGEYLKEDYNKEHPTSCEHDVLYVCGLNLEAIPVETVHELSKLGFYPGDGDYDARYTCFYNKDGEYEGEIDFDTISNEDWDNIKGELTNCFHSYRYGSC